MRNVIKTLYILPICFVLFACYKEELVVLSAWTDASHSGSAKPNYSVVFDDSKVNRMDIVINSKDWKSMQSELDDIIGNSAGPGGDFSEETPSYVPCQFYFNNIQWYHVGIRYKGNSSLNAYSTGAKKLPLRLDFDKFEGDYPEIKNQAFYGFHELSLSSNFDDKSLLREKVGPDLFRAFGVPAPRTVFYEVYVDYGDGPIYFGVYTVLEVISDSPMLESQFGSSTGNCYKPDGDGAAFSASSFNLDDIEIKNFSSADKTDVQNFYNALHSTDRTSNPTSWRSNLESVFDVQGFLKYLAVNTTIQNWDTYGNMTHNYYLYHDPADGLIKWIPWDNNEAFQSGKQGGSLSFSFSEINSASWPIIGYLANDTEYKADYESYLDDFTTRIFNTNNMTTLYQKEQGVVSSSAAKETSDYSYLSNGNISSYVSTLISHCTTRSASAQSYVKSQ